MQKRSKLAVLRFLERVRNQVRSQDQLAEIVSRWEYPITRPAVGMWLNGITDPPSWILFAFAEEFRIPLTDFVAGQSWEERLTAAEEALATVKIDVAEMRRLLAFTEPPSPPPP